jgi:pentatricopeptide repeat protein
MIGDGVSPDCITYTTMINELCRRNDVKKAIELWNSMTEKGIRPDRVAYNTLIHGCCVAGEMGKATELRNEMLRQGLIPNNKTSRTTTSNDTSSKS